MKDKIFGVLQRVGRSFMLPIALLPVAGLLLGIGSSFTNETMLAAYGLNSVIHPGTLIYTILDVMSQTGSAVFNNLALLFAMGVASAFLSAVPGLLWASSAWLVFAAPVLLPVSIWLYALVFALSSLWFTHYLLAELALLRQNTSQSRPPITPFHH